MSVTPIRADITPEMDPVRELCAFAVQNIEAYAEGDEPVSLAIVVIGKRSAGAISWSVVEDKCIGEVCGYASALLANRAALGE